MKIEKLSSKLLGTALLVCASAAFAQESLIDPASYRGIAADRRAYRVGDILTVNVLEAARARSGASTDASGDIRVRGAVATRGYEGGVNAGLSASNSGSAQTSRVGELRTQLSVRVVDVQPDGMLAVAGVQSLIINGEDQQIVLSGLVRPDDILSDNSIWSHRMADAQVEFSGTGVVGRAQRQSTVYRILKWLRLL